MLFQLGLPFHSLDWLEKKNSATHEEDNLLVQPQASSWCLTHEECGMLPHVITSCASGQEVPCLQVQHHQMQMLPLGEPLFFFFNKLLSHIEMYLTYSVVLVSSIQQSDWFYMYLYLFPLGFIPGDWT